MEKKLGNCQPFQENDCQLFQEIKPTPPILRLAKRLRRLPDQRSPIPADAPTRSLSRSLSKEEGRFNLYQGLRAIHSTLFRGFTHIRSAVIIVISH